VTRGERTPASSGRLAGDTAGGIEARPPILSTPCGEPCSDVLDTRRVPTVRTNGFFSGCAHFEHAASGQLPELLRRSRQIMANLTRSTLACGIAALTAVAACEEPASTTGLHPEGPPKIQQVVMKEQTVNPVT